MAFEAPSTFYRRHLPHYQPAGATFFVTFRFAGSLPIEVVARLKEEHVRGDRDRQVTSRGKGYFSRFDEALDRCLSGPKWLNVSAVADAVKEAIHHRDGKLYDLLAYCIMPNHVHMVFVGRNDIPTYKMLQSLKRHTALRANEYLGRRGAFWQDESYDHVVRSPRELKRIIAYVLNNPVKAGLVRSWEEWKWSYVKEDVAL
jgi:putative transposase